MKTSLRTLWLILLLSLTAPTLFAITGCGGEAEEEAGDGDEIDIPDPDDPDSAPPGTVNNLGFYVRVVDDDKYSHYMSKDGAFNTDCLIDDAATSSQDITCLVDVQEGDLWFHGIDLNYNVPAEMCNYARVTPYYYYNYETGYGPSRIVLDVNEAAGVTSVTGCTVRNGLGVDQAGCAVNPEITINTSDQSFTCLYDYSQNEGPNCCLGSYTLVKNITGDRTATETVTAEWGGVYEGCMGGAGAHSWSKKTKDGLPRPLIHFTDEGLNETMEITSPGELDGPSSIAVANYYGDLDHTHTGFLDLVSTSTLPYAIDPIDDRDGTPMSATSPVYQFECLDTSYEVKHRIKLYIREWNTYSQFLLHGTSNGVSGDSNVGGVEDGVDCSYAFSTEECNDVWDWDDFLNWLDLDMDVTTDLYDMSDVTNRSDYFPSEGENN